MAPSEKTITDALRSAVEEVFNSAERENLTVRLIRDKVEGDLELEKGLLVQGQWKDKTKRIIKGYAEELIQAEEAKASIEVKPEPEKPKPAPQKMSSPVKKGTKRSSTYEKLVPKKRQKKEETPSETSELSDAPSEPSLEESSESEFGESDGSEAPKLKRNSKSKSKSRTPVKGRSNKKAKVESDEEEEDDISTDSFGSKGEDSNSEPAPKKAKKEAMSRRQSKKAKVESDSESEKEAKVKSTSEQENSKSPHKAKSKPTSQSQPLRSSFLKPEDEDSKAETKENDSDSSEMSIVRDEIPKLKRKRRSKSDVKSESSTRSSKIIKSKSTSAKPTKDLSADDVQMKTLQSHLVKCGVRKIWGFELKQYGDDTKAKIRHLQKMLKDIGMTGRFSNERAREIKETRELRADLEAVKEGESKWGLDSGRRATRVQKSLKESSGTGEDENEDPTGDEGKNTRRRSISEKPIDRVARVKQDLAFLGDEESDSD